MEAREVHSSGRCGIGETGGTGPGGRLGLRTILIVGGEKERELLDGVEPQRDWALMDDVSAAID